MCYNGIMERIVEKLQLVIKSLFGMEVTPEVVVAPVDTGADYATNVALKLAKVAHKNPLQIAEEIKEELIKSDSEMTVEVAAPGFLNLRLGDSYFIEKVRQLAEDDLAKIVKQDYRGQVFVTEFSDPNPFKVLHVGHLYTSAVGDSIARMMSLAGAEVKRVNFGGDVGLHVAKTIYALLTELAAASSIREVKERSEDWLTLVPEEEMGRFLRELTVERIAQCYVVGTRAYEDDEQAKAKIVALNKEIYRIAESGEQEGVVQRVYWRGRELSYAYFDEFYARIGVKFDRYYPESKVAQRGLKEVREHTGAVYEKSDGAVVFQGGKIGLHTRVFINAQGIPTYEAKDVGLIFTKWDDYRFDRSIVITGNEIIDYMKVVLASVKEYAPELVERTRHLTHGMVKLPGSVKMSSRRGNFLKAVDVLEMVKELVNNEVIALAAIKYAFLKYKMGGDIVFDPTESVSTTGNSGVYLLYATVRAKKILSKVAVKQEVDRLDAEEKELCKKLTQWAEVLNGAIKEVAPYKVCAFLYELAQEFSRFYEKVKVAGSEREGERGLIVKAYVTVMEQGLETILGIQVPEEM